VAGPEIAPPEPEEALVCSNPDCSFAQTGECVDGLDPAGCPHTSHALAEPIEEEPAEPLAPAIVRLFGISPLTPREADLVAAEHGATVILLAGEAEVGKTTLLISLFELFRHGPVSDVRFAGSQTLLAFERRAWPGRAASGADRPDTDRTAEGVWFLHLLVEHEGMLRDLLLTDIWGETFENVIDGAAASNELPIAARADVAMLMVDGERIADAAERQDAIRRARMLAGGLSERGVLRPQARLIVALNKTDLLSDEDKQWWLENREQVAEPARRRLTDVRCIEIAARPAPAPHTPEHVGDLLAAVLEPIPPHDASVPDDDNKDGRRRAFWSQR